jgi:hypothetical protein
MGKSPSLEDTLSLLNEVQDNPASEEAIAALRHILNCKHSVAVARVAKLVHKSEIRQLIPELVASFDRFMENAATKDPNCLAKKAIAEALYRSTRSNGVGLGWKSRYGTRFARGLRSGVSSYELS